MALKALAETPYRFFYRAAGWADPPGRAACARQLAQAEAWAANPENRIEFRWVVDPDCTEDEFEFEADKAHVREHGAVGCIMARPCQEHGFDCRHTEQLGSLWGITESLENRRRDEYRRVVEAELALEAMPRGE